MASEKLLVTLNGAPVYFSTFDKVHQWCDEEVEEWLFLNEVGDPWNGYGITNDRINELRSRASNTQGGGGSVVDLGPYIEELFAGHRTDAAIYSKSEIGKTILRIKETHGARAAAFAIAFNKQRVSLSSANSPADLAAAMTLAMPDLAKPEDLAKRHREDRQSGKQAVAAAIEKIKEEAEVRESQWVELRQRLRRRHLKWMTRATRRIVKADRLQNSAVENALEKIIKTEVTYLEKMRLQAPVDYWTKKALAHEIKERAAQKRVVLFFLIIIPTLIVAFLGVGYIVLTNSNGAKIYVVAGAGLATVSGTIFWVGRLLTKLYLSEHHLRHDAEERAVMTQTYLALTNESAAQESDRQIVLGALFRNTPDGIVKDDGLTDASLAALVARLVGGNR